MGYLNIPPAEFLPSDYQQKYESGHEFLSNCGSNDPLMPSDHKFKAAVHLPDGAVVKKISYQVFDNTGNAKNIQGRLFRTSHADPDSWDTSAPTKY